MSKFFLVDTVLKIDGGTSFDGHEVMTEKEIKRFNLAKKIFGGETIEYLFNGFDVVLSDLEINEENMREITEEQKEMFVNLNIIVSGVCPTDYIEGVIDNSENVEIAEIEIDGVKVAMVDCFTEGEFLTSLETNTDLKFKPTDEIVFREIEPRDAMEELLEYIIL